MLRYASLAAAPLALAAALMSADTSSAGCGGSYSSVYYAPPTRVIHTVPRVTHHVAYPSISIAHKPIIAPLAPAPSSSTEVEVGSTLTATAGFLGVDPGFVLLQVGSAKLQCEVIDWTASTVTFRMPSLGLTRRASAKLELVRPNGTIARNFRVRLKPKADLIVHAGELAPSGSLASGLSVTPGTADTAGLQLTGSAASLTSAR